MTAEAMYEVWEIPTPSPRPPRFRRLADALSYARPRPSCAGVLAPGGLWIPFRRRAPGASSAPGKPATEPAAEPDAG